MTRRPSEDEILLGHADLAARRGTCARLQVGALVATDGRILSSGRNGAPAGLPHCTHLDDSPCEISVHAETNAIAYAARPVTFGATLFLTHAPCLACTGVLLGAGIGRVVYRHNYRSTAGVERLIAAGVQVEHHEGAP